MDIGKHINLIKNHGYKGKIGIVKHPINGIVMLAAKERDVVLYKPYDVREYDSREEQKYNRTHCTIEVPYSEEEIQERLKEGNIIKTHSTCVGVPLSMIEEIKID